jgi:hypothetical protein
MLTATGGGLARRLPSGARKISDWLSRAALRHYGTKLLCKECNGLYVVTDFQPLSRRAVLSCGHSRPISVESR